MSSRTQRVIHAINELSREPFGYGSCDCCLFAYRVAQSFAKLPPLGRSYANRDEAYALLGEGGVGLFVSTLLGRAAVSVSETETGDPLLLVAPKIGELLAVRLDDRAVYKTVVGVGWAPVARALCGWRVE